MRGRMLTSMKLIEGKWLITSHKDDSNSSKDTEYHIQCWDISGSGKPVNTGASTVITLGGDNSSLTILEVQMINDGKDVLIVLDAALYLHNAYVINR